MGPGLDPLARYASDAPAEGRSRVVEPGAAERVLTDDHAPLEWLTDRFLDETERESLRRGDARSEALRDLLDRQTTGLFLIGAGWLVLLVVLRLRT